MVFKVCASWAMEKSPPGTAWWSWATLMLSVSGREHEVVQCAGGEPRCPLDGLVDGVLLEEVLCGAVEQFGLGGQDPPAKALVLLALNGGGGRDVRVGEVRG